MKDMRENLAQNFKFNKKSGPFVLLALGLVPSLLVFAAYKFGVYIPITPREEVLDFTNYLL